MQVGQALQYARLAGVARLDAQVLLARCLQRPRAWLLAHDDESLAAEVEQQFRADLARRARGEPLAYIVGEREFHGLRLKVTPEVLVPRPETELLVDWALELLQAAGASPRPPEVVDLGTGSGAIALAVKHGRPGAAVTAVDNDPRSLSLARHNAQALALDIDFHCGDWWAAVGGRRFDLALSNPPYIAADDPHLAALSYEPPAALTPGGDGLGALRRIIEAAPLHLRPGAFLLLEHGHDQAGDVRGMLADQGWREIQTRDDLAGWPRCTGAAAPG